ncbi:MAG: L-2-amino-thiazoline-4-carboxylic acid hydrolase [Anaerolineaceae bacterium]|nr:L-2-amino-thiazoline-4-carboxylic acid hydrolase [Anaerolineaceae bacterium]
MNLQTIYYTKQRRKLLKNHQKMMNLGQPLMAARYGERLAETAVTASTTEFGRLIPQIPYIGGKANSLTDTLVQMTSLLALYRVLKREGKPIADIGDLFYEMAQAQVNRFPQWLRHLTGRLYLSRWNVRRLRQKAAVSQQRQYSGDFVIELVPAHDTRSIQGINYLECGIVKFFAQQGAAELTPYMCRIDYLLFPAMGIQLNRTGTIAQGCTHCDFRFNQLREKQP